MSILPDAVTIKRLVLIKQVYIGAELKSHNPGSILSKLQSIIEFDWANEAMLKQVIESVGAKLPHNGDPNLHELIGAANDGLRGAGLDVIPNPRSLRTVHAARNASQHHMTIPSENTIEESRFYTRDFLEWATITVWSIDFDSLRLVELIRHDKLRSYLITAEEKRSQRDYLGSASNAIAALKLALDLAGRSMISTGPLVLHLPDSSQYRPSDESYECNASEIGRMIAEQVTVKLDEIVSMMVLSTAGIELRSYASLQKLVGHVRIMADGSFRAHAMQGQLRELSSDDAEFTTYFAIDSIVRIEEMFESL